MSWERPFHTAFLLSAPRTRPFLLSTLFFPPLPQVEELSKKLADHDQASKVQQQKLKVGRMGEGRCSVSPRTVVGVGAEEGHPGGLAALGGLPVAQEPPAGASWEL